MLLMHLQKLPRLFFPKLVQAFATSYNGHCGNECWQPQIAVPSAVELYKVEEIIADIVSTWLEFD